VEPKLENIAINTYWYDPDSSSYIYFAKDYAVDGALDLEMACWGTAGSYLEFELAIDGKKVTEKPQKVASSSIFRNAYPISA